MWTRRELKEQAKDALKRNYWKAVLVTVLFGALLGGTGGAATADRKSTRLNSSHTS